jgi:hypothetical protein
LAKFVSTQDHISAPMQGQMPMPDQHIPGRDLILIVAMEQEAASSAQTPRGHALPRHQSDRVLVEGHEYFAAQPSPLIHDRAIGKIAAGLKDGKAELSSRPVHHHIARIHQTANGRRHVILG